MRRVLLVALAMCAVAFLAGVMGDLATPQARRAGASQPAPAVVRMLLPEPIAAPLRAVRTPAAHAAPIRAITRTATPRKAEPMAPARKAKPREGKAARKIALAMAFGATQKSPEHGAEPRVCAIKATDGVTVAEHRPKSAKVVAPSTSA